MQYGFVINQETCIGCHACTVACKAENDVPVGGFRTNVKYVEIGKFPQVKRNFLVQRCNHCTDAPCVTICPVNALSKRRDGIVDIDRDACIGCRACMQACPYDALYLNEDLGAVEKCHFCAHRIEKGLEPACVTVCPVGAIIPGDFHDPESKVSLLKRAQDLKVRRPEQGTGPNVMYIGASDVSLNPGAAARDSKLQIWSQRRQTKPENWPTSAASEPDAREVLNADHKVEWGWPVALYLLTKGIAAGATMIAPFFAMFNSSKTIPWWLPETVGLVFMLITVFLLIEDLKKPMHFYKLFTRPNWSSWLVKGGIVLTVFGGLSALILVLGFLRSPNERPFSLADAYHGGTTFGFGDWVGLLRWVNAFVGIFVAGYTAFLFKQCKGRDLWEADGLFWHLIAQSITAGAGFFLLVGMGNVVSVGAFAIGALSLGALHFVRTKENDKTENFKQASSFLYEFKFAKLSVVRGTLWIIPAFAIIGVSTLQLPKSDIYFPIADFLLIGIAASTLFLLYQYERAFVRAGQLPPLS